MIPDTKTLRTLRGVVSAGSFAAAGRELGYTASAVSQQIAGLEQDLGLRLFVREASRVVPTEAAHHLVQRSAEIFDLLDQIEIDIARLGAGEAGRLRIGTFNSAGGAIVGPAIARFLVRRRDVEITLDEGEPYELFPRVADGSIDVALGFAYDLVPSEFPLGLELSEIMTERLFVVAPRKHRLAAKERIGLGELAAETWVAHREETPSSRCLTALCTGAGFAPDIAFRSNNLGTVLGIVDAGLAVALVPEIGLRDAPDGVVSLPVEGTMPRRQIITATRPDDASALADPFVRALRHVAGRQMREA